MFYAAEGRGVTFSHILVARCLLAFVRLQSEGDRDLGFMGLQVVTSQDVSLDTHLLRHGGELGVGPDSELDGLG